jgi:hypothetical protein
MSRDNVRAVIGQSAWDSGKDMRGGTGYSPVYRVPVDAIYLSKSEGYVDFLFTDSGLWSVTFYFAGENNYVVEDLVEKYGPYVNAYVNSNVRNSTVPTTGKMWLTKNSIITCLTNYDTYELYKKMDLQIHPDIKKPGEYTIPWETSICFMTRFTAYWLK